MTTATTSGTSRPQRKTPKTKRANASTPGVVTKPFITSLPQAGGRRYTVLAGKSLLAAAFFFGVICALVYTAADKSKPVAGQRTTTAKKSGAAVVSKIDLPVRNAPRRDAKILARVVYGARVEVVAQDGGWAQVRAAGEDVAGWVEKTGLNF